MVDRRNRPTRKVGGLFRKAHLALLFWALPACPDPPPSPPDPVGPKYLVEVRARTCTDPQARAAGPFERVELDLPAPSRQYLWSAAAAVGDVDGDGKPDVIALSDQGPVLFRNPTWGPEPLLPLSQPMGAALVDVDADGDLDLYVARHAGADALLLNDGTGGFTDGSDALNADSAGNTSAVSFADIDGDGDLDGVALSVGDFVDDADTLVRDFPASGPAHLWINGGDGTFADHGERLPESFHAGFSLAGGLHDLDADGVMDLYSVNDFGGTHGANTWLRGAGDGTFTAPEPGHGLDMATTGMGLAMGDLNGDGFDDLAVAYWGGIRVMESAPGPVWFDQTLVRIPEPFAVDDVAWGGDFADFDNDGDLDLFMSFAHVEFTSRWPNPARQDDRLYLGGPGAWEEVGEAWGLADGSVTRGSVVADLNDDGWLDLIRPSQDDPVLLLSRCGEAGGMGVTLRQDGANPRAIGARVHLVTAGFEASRSVRAGGTSYGSAGSADLHFGLGSEEDGDLVVTWPDGVTATFSGNPASSHVTITRLD